MTKEVWKVWKETTRGRYGHRIYEVSNLGNIKCNGELYECCVDKRKGYKYIGKNLVHRIVAELFLPDWDPNLQVDHINTMKGDNRTCNLRMTTPKENSNNPLTLQHLSESMKGNTSHKKIKN